MDFIVLKLAWDNDANAFRNAGDLYLMDINFNLDKLDFFRPDGRRTLVRIAGEDFIYPNNVNEFKKDIQVQSNPLQRTLNAIE